jgi:hypothetical protein
MKLVRRIILFILCLPFNLIVGWPAVLGIWACWGHKLRWEIAPASGGLSALTCELKPASWPDRTWYARWGASTLGHAIFYGARIRTDGEWVGVQAHEHIHVEQYEGTMAAHALLGLLVFGAVFASSPLAATLVGLGVWFLGYLVFLMGGWLGAILRGEPAYHGSAHEKAARAESGT